MPKRPRNFCRDCLYTWHPRGGNLAKRCPDCGSERVGVVLLTMLKWLLFWWILIPVRVLGFLYRRFR